MTRDEAISRIRDFEPQLRDRGVVHLRLFGSVARNEASAESDVDVIVDMESAKRASLLAVGGVQYVLQEFLGLPVDVSQEEYMKEPVRKRALREAILVF